MRDTKFIQLQLGLRWPRRKILITSVMKDSGASTVLRATMDGNNVVVKKYGPVIGRGRFVTQTQRALENFNQTTSNEKFAANEYILGSQLFGIVVVSFEEGTLVRRILRFGGMKKRRRVLRLCGRWLKNDCGDGKEKHRFCARKHLRNIEEIRPVTENGEHNETLAVLTARLRELAVDLDGVETEKYIGHPDFAPRNLIFQKSGRIVAVDIHKHIRMSISRNAACFLVSKDNAALPRQRPTQYGLDQQEMGWFLKHCIVPERELNSVFVFYVGFFLLKQYGLSITSGAKLETKRQMIVAFLSDLEQGKKISV